MTICANGCRTPNGSAMKFNEARRIAEEIGYPVLVRPSFVLGGRAMEVVHDDGGLMQYSTEAVQASEERPILIEIRMNNSSGLFQVDGLLRAKLRGSGLEPYVEVVAHIDTETEQRLVPVYRLEV